MAEERTFVFANFSRSTSAARISTSATQIQLAEGEGDRFPSPDGTYDEICSIILKTATQYEVMYCTARAGDVLTVERGKEGSTAQVFAAGTSVVHNATSGFWEQMTVAPPPPSVADPFTWAWTPGPETGSGTGEQYGWILQPLVVNNTGDLDPIPDGVLAVGIIGSIAGMGLGFNYGFQIVFENAAARTAWLAQFAANGRVTLGTNTTSLSLEIADGRTDAPWVVWMTAENPDPPQPDAVSIVWDMSSVDPFARWTFNASTSYSIVFEPEPPLSETFEITTANGGNVYGFEEGVFGSSVPTPATFYNGARLVLMEGIGETGNGGFEFFIVDGLLSAGFTEVEIETDGGQVILQLVDVIDGYIDPFESYYYWSDAVWNVADIFSNPKTVTFR